MSFGVSFFESAPQRPRGPEGRRTEEPGRPAILGEGGLCDPLKDRTRKAASALAGTDGLHQLGVAVMAVA